MYIDNQLQLSSAQAVTASAASTNVIDLGSDRDVGMSSLVLALTVIQAATAAGAATVQFQVQVSDDSTFGTGVTTVNETDAIGKATLAAGYQRFIRLQPGTVGRYLRLYYNVGTGPLTAGQFSASIVESMQNSPSYTAPSQN